MQPTIKIWNWRNFTILWYQILYQILLNIIKYSKFKYYYVFRAVRMPSIHSGIIPHSIYLILYSGRLKFAGQITWSKIKNAPMPKLEQWRTSHLRYFLWGQLRAYTRNFTSMTYLILTQGYFQILVTWLSRQILSEGFVLWCLWWGNVSMDVFGWRSVQDKLHSSINAAWHIDHESTIMHYLQYQREL